MARVLFFPFAPGGGLAHVATCLAVARQLEGRGHEAVFAYGGTRPEVLEAAGVRVERVEEVPQSRTSGKTVAQWFRTASELEELVRGDLAVIERVQPDAVVVDLRFPASYAAELAGVPDVMIVHYLRMLPYSRDPDRRARRLRQLRRPLRLGAAVKRWTTADLGGVGRLREVVGGARESLGLPPLEFALRGELVACTTTPLLDPAELPDNWRFVGPISWSFGGPEPGPRSGRPLVYLTESTADRTGFLAQAFRELRDEPVDLAAAAGGHVDIDELRALAPAATVERLLPTRPWVEAADVAIFEGGHYTGCEAQAAGTPAIVVPWRFDQWIWADRVERFGSGIALRPPRAPGAIRRAVRRILRESRYRTAAESLGEHLREWDGAAGTAALVEDVLRR